jgi:hypothetical protein
VLKTELTARILSQERSGGGGSSRAQDRGATLGVPSGGMKVRHDEGRAARG